MLTAEPNLSQCTQGGVGPFGPLTLIHRLGVMPQDPDGLPKTGGYGYMPAPRAGIYPDPLLHGGATGGSSEMRAKCE
eukprot:5112126-Pyramimonas_sp.AAC.1